MDDLKAPKQTRGWDWRRGRHTAVIGIPLIWLLAVALILGIKFAFAASPASPPSSPSPCVRYLTVARDLHVLRLWNLDGQPGGAAFDAVLLAWVNVQSDAEVMGLAYGEPVDARAWEVLWTQRYRQCLTELGGR